ncbi:MAG TPA: hypothetical protein VMG12_32205, partial [Polyangiaceae bacterium]|nr:hypothetical protein [Polyangiaceae bacterium]
PTPDVRNQMVARSRQLLGQTCDSMHMIISRPGVPGAMQRTVLRGMAVVIGGRGKLFVHESVGGCLERLRASGVDAALLGWAERALREHAGAVVAAPPPAAPAS